MSLINIPDPNTTEGKQAIVSSQIRNMTAQSFQQLKRTSLAIRALIFENPLGLLPQQVCDALGTDAGSLWALAQAIASLLNGIIPGTISLDLPNGLVLTVNQDGTVTISVTP